MRRCRLENSAGLRRIVVLCLSLVVDFEPSILVYGYDGDSVEEAQETLTYDMYGALYNFASATQLGLCPQGWHVPSKIEFDELFANLGGIDQAHFQVMQEQAWNVDFDIADEGFSLLPARDGSICHSLSRLAKVHTCGRRHHMVKTTHEAMRGTSRSSTSSR